MSKFFSKFGALFKDGDTENNKHLEKSSNKNKNKKLKEYDTNENNSPYTKEEEKLIDKMSFEFSQSGKYDPWEEYYSPSRIYDKMDFHGRHRHFNDFEDNHHTNIMTLERFGHLVHMAEAKAIVRRTNSGYYIPEKLEGKLLWGPRAQNLNVYINSSDLNEGKFS